MDDLALIEKHLYHLMHLHFSQSNKEVDEKRKAYLMGLANGLNLALTVFRTAAEHSKLDPYKDIPLPEMKL